MKSINAIAFAIVNLAILVVLAKARVASAAPPEGTTPATGHNAFMQKASDLDAMVKDNDYLALGAVLEATTGLSKSEREYVQGVLDSHTGQTDRSVQNLVDVLPGLRSATDNTRYVTALRALAENYARRFDYGRAADTYSLLETTLGEAAPAGARGSERRQVRDNALQYNLLRGQLPQTVQFDATSDAPQVQGHRNPFGLLEVPLSIGDGPTASAESWLFDTGSTLSVVTRSTAERLKLKLLTGSATTLGVGGGEIPLQVAVIPVLRIGSAVVRNAAVLVFEDQALSIGNPAYQIQGILGLPIMEAMGRLTVGPSDRITIGGSANATRSPNLYFDNSKLIVAAIMETGARLFTLDSGATDSVLTERYWREHSAELSKAPRIDYKFAGADGRKAVPARQAPAVDLKIDDTKVTLTQVAVIEAQTNNPGRNAFFGNLGQDLLKSFKSYTLDFGTMRFTAEK